MIHAELELSLRAAGDSHTADLRFCGSGGGAAADLALEVPVAFDPPSLLVLANDWPAYGRALTAQLFSHPRMREAWAAVRGFTQGANTALRLRLRIDPGASALHALRWELLQDPATGMALCRSERLFFARTFDGDDMAPLPRPARAALRALVVVANPSDLEEYNLAPVDVAGELARARTALGDLPTALLARVADVPAPPARGATLEALLDALRAGHSLLTLVCHSSMVKGRPMLWLEKDDGSCDRVPGDTLVQRLAALAPAHRPLLIILTACQTAGRDQNAAVLAALGPQLARAGVGAVIGMQGNVPMAMTEILLPRMLAHLREDGQIDGALARARAALPADQPWWMPALFMRVRDGRLWSDDPAAAAVTPLPAPPGGLTSLAHQLRDPRVREGLAEFHAVFSAARDQIGLLSRYKELHDTLQELEQPFNVVARDRKRVVGDPSAWDNLLEPIINLQDCARAALTIIADPRLAAESAWGAQQLQLAGADLELAQTQADPRRLDLAISRYKRVLARELPRADRRLAACAGDLRLAEVTQALGHVQASLRAGAHDIAALRELATWTTTLEQLSVRLDTLVPAHHLWQDVDTELRRVAESLSGDPTDLELVWGDLLLLTTPLFGGGSEEWAAALNILSAQIGQALSAGVVPQARRLFISYQSRATRRFAEIDKALLATCNELRETGTALAVIVRALDG